MKRIVKYIDNLSVYMSFIPSTPRTSQNARVWVQLYNKLRLNKELLQRMRLEADLASRLRHEHLVYVNTVLENEGTLAIVMEAPSRGELLREIVFSKSNLTENHIFATILGPLLQAVQYLHSEVRKPISEALLSQII